MELTHEQWLQVPLYADTEGRGFKPVPGDYLKNHNFIIEVNMPGRGSSKSAGYDFVSPIGVSILPGRHALIWTDVCAFMEDDEVLELHVRSSVGIKKGLMLANVTGIIDADYYGNEDNFGNIGICLYNRTENVVTIEAGERIAQGVFKKYLTANRDYFKLEGAEDVKRSGGFGSTGK